MSKMYNDAVEAMRAYAGELASTTPMAERRREAMRTGCALVKAIADGRVLIVGKQTKWGLARANELESTRTRMIGLVQGRITARSELVAALRNVEEEAPGVAAEYAEYCNDYVSAEHTFLTMLRPFLADMYRDGWYGLKE